MAYCDIVELKEYLGIQESIDDILLDSLINSSKSVIDGFCNRTFEALEDATRYFDAYSDVDGQTLYFDADICAITTVTNGDGEVISSTHYVTEPRNAKPYYAIRLKASAPYQWTCDSNGNSENAIAILGKWAYSDNAPDDIRFACVRLVSYLYRQKDNAADMDRAVIVGNGTVLPSRIPDDIKTILKPYRRVTK